MMVGDKLVASAIDQLRKELDTASELARALNNLAAALRFFGDALVGHTGALGPLGERMEKLAQAMPGFEIDFEEEEEQDNGEDWKYREEE